ncbi:hypothetical protein N9L06_03670 [Mariniblastus sp.]|nr:hypothetical protein [Mariniblastus sp.]
MSNATVERFQIQKQPSVTWSLCWKQGYEFALSMIVLTVFSLAIYLMCGSFEPSCIGDYQVALSALTPTTICFAFVACFIAFVSENDSRTRSFLMNLPLSGWHIGAVKILMVVLAVAVFFAVQLALAGVWMSIEFESNVASTVDQNNVIENFSEALLSIASVIGVAVFISLFACSFWSSPWASILTAVALAFYTPFAIGWAFSNNPDLASLSGFSTRLVKGSLLFFAIGAVWYPLRWLRRRPWQIGRYVTALAETLEVEPARTESRSQGSKLLHLPRGGKFGALLWQSFAQQNNVLMLVFFGLSIFLLRNVIAYWPLATANAKEAFSASLIPALGLAGLAFGWTTLCQDKMDNNREFFQQHREHGVSLLIARITCSLSALMLLVGLAFLAVKSFYPGDWIYLRTVNQLDEWAIGVSMSGLAGYSAMLLCSMAFRSHIHAMGVALLVWLVEIWSFRAINEHAEFSWLLALPFLWLASCIFYGPAWLSGRRDWRWTAYFTVILLLAFSVPIYAWIRLLIEF